MAEANPGAWVDSKTGQVVGKEPEEGIQLLAPGIEPTDAQRAYVDSVRALAAGEGEPVGTVTTKTTTSKPSK